MEREAVRIDVVIPIEVYAIPEKEIEHRKARIVGEIPFFLIYP